MKKLFTLTLAVAMLFQATTTFAAVSNTLSSDSMEPAISTLLSFNRWLYADSFGGVRFINDNLEQVYQQAQAWDDNVWLYNVDISFQQSGQADCSFEFGAPSKSNELFRADCVDLAKGEHVQGEVVSADSPVDRADLFNFPVMKLRKFVSDAVIAGDILRSIRSSMNETSTPNVDFKLFKMNGVPTWKWVISDGQNHEVDVFADSSHLNAPLVFQGL